MFERLMVRASRLAAARADLRRERLAARLGGAGVRAVVEGERVVLAGRQLAARMALEPELRWLESGDE